MPTRADLPCREGEQEVQPALRPPPPDGVTVLPLPDFRGTWVWLETQGPGRGLALSLQPPELQQRVQAQGQTDPLTIPAWPRNRH